MSTIFTKIIQGEVPSYKIYEDELTYAFLDNAPEVRGHTLVVPKVEVDKLYELPDEYYTAVMETVRKLAKRFEKVSGKRTVIKVIGSDVPHAHVHLMPFDEGWKDEQKQNFSPEEFEEIRKEFEYKD